MRRQQSANFFDVRLRKMGREVHADRSQGVVQYLNDCSGKECAGEGTNEFAGLPGGTRTPDLLLRRQLLYPVELRAVEMGQGIKKMVGAVGFELTTYWSQTSCATRLRYAPRDRIVAGNWVQKHGLFSRAS